MRTVPTLQAGTGLAGSPQAGRDYAEFTKPLQVLDRTCVTESLDEHNQGAMAAIPQYKRETQRSAVLRGEGCHLDKGAKAS